MTVTTSDHRTTITPKKQVLSHKLAALAALAALAFAGFVFTRWHRGDMHYFAETFPVHLMLGAMIAAYLVYLTHALFHSLSTVKSIVCSPAGLDIHGSEQDHHLPWSDIVHIRMGDLYLKIYTAAECIEAAFIDRDDQRAVYRMYNRQVRFTPDAGRFLAPRPRR